MSTLIVAIIIVGTIAAICLLLISIDNKQKHKHMNTLLNRFTESGTKNGLTLSSQEILNDVVIGLDGIRRKLLIQSESKEEAYSQVIDLDEVKSCSVIKHYGAINAGGLKNSKLEQHLEKLVLHFDFDDGKLPFEIPFFRHIDNHIYLLPERERKAKHWETILSKMLQPRVKKIA
jgi:hypothetical protein